MRQLTAILAFIFAVANGYAAYLLASSGVEQVSKEITERGLLIMGGVTVGLFALLLVGQSLRLLVARGQ